MKNLYREFFRVADGEKIRDRVLMTRAAITAILMVIYLVAISATAYAYYACGLTSGGSIVGAQFDATVLVTDAQDQAVPYDPRTNTVQLQPGEYTVKLSREGNAGTGFCVIRAEGGTADYHTGQFAKGSGVEMVFSVKVEGAAAITLYMVPHWGTSSMYPAYIQDTANPPERYVLTGAALVFSAPLMMEPPVTVTTTTSVAATTTTGESAAETTAVTDATAETTTATETGATAAPTETTDETTAATETGATAAPTETADETTAVTETGATAETTDQTN